jgi:aspartyl-tRNA(Asn)/glutamyl-tRNA(Gln) amidotransferase subunit B
MHDDDTETTFIDYNRAGVPLMELVTEPVMHTAEEAGNFARELQVLLRYLGASEANMEKGEMRVEANVSVAKRGERSAAYVEIKNLNSFRTMERAISYEIERQKKLLAEGKVLEKQTLGWDEDRQKTFPQRIKEGSADYRYFPDPDLPSLRISEIPGFSTEELLASLPELPHARRERYISLGIKPADADLFVREAWLGNYFDTVASELKGEKAALISAANYLANDMMNIVRDFDRRDSEFKDKIGISPSSLASLMRLVAVKKISSRAAKDLLAEIWGTDQDPTKIAHERGLLLTLDPEIIRNTITKVIENNPTVVNDFKGGKQAALEYLVGQCMKILRGAVDPENLRNELRKALS